MKRLSVLLLLCALAGVAYCFDTIYWNPPSQLAKTWQVKSGYRGPGKNYWGNTNQNVWVDSENQMHLRFAPLDDGLWYASEITLDEVCFHRHFSFLSIRCLRLSKRVVRALDHCI